MNNQSSDLDVVVIGAGFAGLTAARSLAKAGVSVVVLEADDRVGGRSMAGSIAGHVVDRGGQWVGPTQHHLLGLAEELGVKTYPQYVEGDHIMDIAGREARYKEGEDLPLEPADVAELNRVMGELDALTGKIDAAAPWTAEDADALDAQTFESWLLSATASEPARSVFRVIAQVVFCGRAGQLSLLNLLTYAAASGGIVHMISSRGGSQDSLFVGGAWQLAAKMAEGLGDAVVVNAPVRSIAQTDDGVTVTSDVGVWTAALAVVTAAPPMAARISYFPPMPPGRDSLTQRMPMGSIIKVHVAYETPFWRARGLSGSILSDRTVTGMWIDLSLAAEGGLVGFFAGGHAQAWADRSPEDRRARVLDDLATYLGPEATTPIDYIDEVWSARPWQRGAYMSVPGPGLLTSFGPALREPVGRIHWAGTETADVSMGYLDGAIQSGKRVAHDCIKRLRP
ncbi:flavin monoamine oxidase family protein [Streptomyces wuyuanensis]|uniref:flavin monoamine oxidase family protein n=1 Tax=Streptomyces wuyuanensis TaxID=1196353 RepID=UPI0037B4184A